MRDCTLTIANGEVVVICGPSGSGKSTLIKCINGLERVQGGSIHVDGEPVIQSSAALLRLRRKVSMVFQSFELYPHMKVIDNITLAPVVALRQNKIQAVEKAKALLAQVGMAAYAERWPASLSGGQQQRVAIARALATDPLAVLFDEPTSALDPEMINEVLDVIRLLAQANMTLVIVTHEMGFARSVADRIVFMEDGAIVEDTPTAQFFANPRSERAARFLDRILTH
ncbi:MAG TPA: amino acid ABC transporter ATP-binding protein [Bradyrhizobium sp.]|nr:amino acid ABC transporter ATP-binding protein [Bradyrhizobium sp.]